jgi:hypothetical protein
MQPRGLNYDLFPNLWFIKRRFQFDISGYHGGEYEDILGYNAA